jgi:Tol biopolymer transport system component
VRNVAELTAEMVVDSNVPITPALSPDGRWIAFVVRAVGQADEHPVSALWIAAADGRTPPRRLTAGTVADSDPRWAPDSEWIYFLSDRSGSAQLHRIRPAGGDAEALTTWKSGIDQHLPLTDPGVVALTAPDEPTEEDERRSR